MKSDLQPGTLEGFFGWINERHNIYIRRASGLPKPWTADPILQRFKFTNPFRQLDRGTLALHYMLARKAGWTDYICCGKMRWLGSLKECSECGRARDTRVLDLPLLVFNIIWYRQFNLDVHANRLGFVTEYEALENYIHKCEFDGEQIFTAAHLTVGVPGERKYISTLRWLRKVWKWKEEVAAACIRDNTLKSVFQLIQNFDGIGGFIGYEIVSDFRWTDLLCNATDKLQWANIGPGCRRGLQRLGLPITTESLRKLWDMAPGYLGPHVLSHLHVDDLGDFVYPPFELREIEHSLCEFDKYERVRTGAGRPRQSYPGVAGDPPLKVSINNAPLHPDL